MIVLSNGHRMEYVAASGSLGYDGKGWPQEKLLARCGRNFLDLSLFTKILKTITFLPNEGHGYTQIDFVKGGMVNAVGLKNPGFEWWLDNVGYKLPEEKESQRHLVLSLYSQKPTRLRWFSEMLVDFKRRLVGVELNFSCPSAPGFSDWKADMILKSYEAMKSYDHNLPVFCKLSAGQRKLVPEICRQAKGLIDVFDINSVPWHMVFPRQQSPFAHLGGGGVSGKIAQEVNWNFLRYLSNLTDIPVIGPSIWDYEDIGRVRSYGAKAISFGSVFTCYPWRPTQFVRKDMKEK
ncbi:MAG: hypothetical protein PHT40_04175 [Patescibacteria group bacterium]|nr:hypothetical protein [Patescibacteria group bacterium]